MKSKEIKDIRVNSTIVIEDDTLKNIIYDILAKSPEEELYLDELSSIREINADYQWYAGDKIEKLNGLEYSENLI